MGRVQCTFEEGTGATVPFTMMLADGGVCAGVLRRSARSKHVRLIIDGRGLRVTAPRLFRFKRDLAPILEKNLDWILQSFDKVRLRARRTAATPIPLPQTIVLPALEETWRVEVATDLGAKRFAYGDGRIVLSKDFTRAEARATLRMWLKLRAREALPPMLRELAAQQGLTVARVLVKELKSRWGSCSSRRNVNLNAHLLFLPPDLVRHVLLHELCHLLEMNHGPKFHERLRAMDMEADRHAAELRTAWRRIPAWAALS